jgi:hypothetical protein
MLRVGLQARARNALRLIAPPVGQYSETWFPTSKGVGADNVLRHRELN